jgi:hypothetical protein
MVTPRSALQGLEDTITILSRGLYVIEDTITILSRGLYVIYVNHTGQV